MQKLRTLWMVSPRVKLETRRAGFYEFMAYVFFLGVIVVADQWGVHGVWRAVLGGTLLGTAIAFLKKSARLKHTQEVLEKAKAILSAGESAAVQAPCVTAIRKALQQFDYREVPRPTILMVKTDVFQKLHREAMGDGEHLEGVTFSEMEHTVTVDGVLVSDEEA